MRKSIKKGIAVVTVGAMALGMTACGSDATTNSTSTASSSKSDKEYLDAFKKAGKAIADDSQGTAIQNVISLQGNSIEYLDVSTTDGDYTEYYVSDTSVLSDSEKETVHKSREEMTDDSSEDVDTSEEGTENKDSKEEDSSADDSESASGETSSTDEGYVLSDWLTYTKDGKPDKFYTLNNSYTGEDKNKEWYIFGKDMTDLASQRSSMFVDLLADGISDVEDQGTQTGTTEASGDVKVHIYTAKIKGDVVTKMLSLQGSMQYEDALSTIKTEGTKVDDIVLDQLNNYNDYYNSLWTVGDGDISWGIMEDKEGKLAFVDISTGGAGTTLTLTKELIVSGIDFRDKPDFSSNESYADFIVDAIKTNLEEEHEAHTNAEAANGSATGETVDGNTVTDESTAEGTDVTDATVSDDVTSKDTQGTVENATATEESNNTGTNAEAGTDTTEAETETDASKETAKTSKEDKSVEATPAADATKDANTSK